MSNLHDLLKSLATVCVSYHHEMTGSIDAIEPLVHSILQKSSFQIETQLTELINEAVKVDITRASFLNYVLFEIKGILNFLALAEIPKEEDMVGLQMQLSQFLQCTQKLLDTSQGTELPFSYNNQEVKMYGFVRRSIWTSWSVCGNAMQNLVFTPFRLTTTTRKLE